MKLPVSSSTLVSIGYAGRFVAAPLLVMPVLSVGQSSSDIVDVSITYVGGPIHVILAAEGSGNIAVLAGEVPSGRTIARKTDTR